MENKKLSVSPMLILVIVLGILLAGVIVLSLNYHLVDFKLYERGLTELDLRGESISPSHYNNLTRAMPDCRIHWDVPFQGRQVDNDASDVTVEPGPITKEDLLALTYLPNLETVHGEGHEDYQSLAALQQLLPGVQVLYTVQVGEVTISSTHTGAALGAVTQEELQKLDYLPALTSLSTRGSLEDAALLRSYCQQRDLDFSLNFHGTLISPDAESVTLEDLTDEELPQLTQLQNLKKLHLVTPQASPEAVFALEDQFPGAEVTWEVSIGGELFSSDLTMRTPVSATPGTRNPTEPDVLAPELDLSDVEIDDLDELEHALRYLPQVTQIFLGEQEALNNEDLAQFRDQVREQYKVVWHIRMGESNPIRTDINYFMPGRDFHLLKLHFMDGVSHNLRYCEDLICVDVGHLGVSDVSFLEGLVNLEYLILAHTGVIDLTGIEHCTKIKFLEIHWTGVRDLAPLRSLTALEDLNFGETWPDVSVLKEMPWLKNIYMIGGDRGDAWELSQALPDARVVASGDATVAGGWRSLPNYFAMRDALHAYYMN